MNRHELFSLPNVLDAKNRTWRISGFDPELYFTLRFDCLLTPFLHSSNCQRISGVGFGNVIYTKVATEDCPCLTNIRGVSG